MNHIRGKIAATGIGKKIKKYRDIILYRDDIKLLKREITPIIQELKRAGIHLLFVCVPKANRVNSLSAFQWERIRNWTFNFNHITEEDAAKLKAIYTDEVSADYLLKVYDGVKVYEQNGIRRLADFSSEYVNIINGERVTKYQPEESTKNIFVFGSCTARGTGVEDSRTIESFLQKKLIKEGFNEIKVCNKGIGCGYFLLDDFKRIDETSMKTGDIAIVMESFAGWEEQALLELGVNYMDASIAFNLPFDNNQEWFVDCTAHTTSVGNRIIAEYIYLEIKNVLPGIKGHNVQHKKSVLSETQESIPELQEYLAELKRYKRDTKRNGSIVMNCNPFTYGHRYLIEEAAKEMETLYIFVVEEDKSYFKFDDRIKLVKEGTADLKNVVVIPSGKFIISAITFPGYFVKDNDPTIVVDITNDLRIFCKHIAPVLDISVRYAGEEPIDMVTNQYNTGMKTILPEYGLKFTEIPRKCSGEDVISASRIRRLLKTRDFADIQELVPETTYGYLLYRFGESDD